MSDEQIRVETWPDITEYFRCSQSTVRKKFRQEMFDLGVVFKSHVGRGKKPLVWGYPSMIMAYVREKNRLGQL